jgi:hypothetical protein
MTQKNKTQFALEFFGKSILLLSSQDDVSWDEIGLADMGDPEFRETMKDFQAEVSKQGLRKAKVAVFLPLEDVALDALSHTNLSEELEQFSGSAIENMSFTAGSPNEMGKSNVLYAQRDTLLEASKFIAQFGFAPTYFSARVDIAGFDEQPKLMLAENKPHAALAMLPAAVAVLIFGAFGIWTFSQNAPEATPRTMQLSSTSSIPLSGSFDLKSPTNSLVIPVVSRTTEPTDLAAPLIPETPLNPTTQNQITTNDTPEIVPIVSAGVDDIVEHTFQLSQLVAAPVENNLDHVAEPAVTATQATSLAKQPVVIEAALTTIPETEIAVEIPSIDISDVVQVVPEDANYPRPTLRTGKRIIPAEPEILATVEPSATVVEPKPSIDTSISRPPKRPAQVIAKAASDAAQKAIAQDLVNQEIKKEQQLAASLASASRRAKGTAKRPPIKTSSFRSLAGNLKQPAKPAAAVATVTKPSKPATPTKKPTAVASAKPTTTKKPVKESTSRASTTFSKRSLSLIGVFGTPSKRSALFRTSTGSYRSVKIGQRIAGWKVVAIGESTAKVTKGSRSKTMKLPK